MESVQPYPSRKALALSPLHAVIDLSLWLTLVKARKEQLASPILVAPVVK